MKFLYLPVPLLYNPAEFLSPSLDALVGASNELSILCLTSSTLWLPSCSLSLVSVIPALPNSTLLLVSASLLVSVSLLVVAFLDCLGQFWCWLAPFRVGAASFYPLPTSPQNKYFILWLMIQLMMMIMITWGNENDNAKERARPVTNTSLLNRTYS